MARSTGTRVKEVEAPKLQEVVKRSTALVRPGDITDAVDSRDLLDTILSQNLERIGSKVDKRIVDTWVVTESKRRKDVYEAKAKAAYEKMWSVCGNSSVGHNLLRHEVRGYNVKQCQDCKWTRHNGTNYHGEPDTGEERTAAQMNADMINAMVDQMIALDIEAGLFSWPTVEDYPNIRKPRTKKKGLFKR